MYRDTIKLLEGVVIVSHIGQGEIQTSLIGMNGSRGVILILLMQENKSKACDRMINCVIKLLAT